MHTYHRTEASLWTVGFELPAEHGLRHWRSIRDFGDEGDAMAFCSYLNGGLEPALATVMFKFYDAG